MDKRNLWMISALVLGMAAAACAPRYRAPRLAPAGSTGHPTALIRFAAEVEGQRQKGRLAMDVDGSRARVLFLSPLNRVVMELRIERKRALLLNRRLRRYWRGDFAGLVWRMWRLRLDYGELRDLVFNPDGSDALRDRGGMHLDVEKDPATGLPRKLEVSGPSTRLRLSVLRRRRAAGALTYSGGLEGFSRAELDQVIAYED